MDLSGLEQTSRRAAPPMPVFSAVVVRADESGLWVAPIGEDTRTPVGPCKGGWTANGTRVPPGASVALLLTEDGPWAIGVDNPALAINDATLAPFANSSFELVETVTPGDGYPIRALNWSDFWRMGNRPVQYDMTVEDGTAAHGLRSLRINSHGSRPMVNSTQWSVPAGSSIELSLYARAEGDPAVIGAYFFTNTPGGTPGPFAPGAATTAGGTWYPTEEWLRYSTVITLAPGHTELALFIDAGALVNGDVSSVWIDNADADIVQVNPATAHQDVMRRAALTIAGGGVRQVTAGGNVSWGQPLTISGIGREAGEAPDGRFEISMPANTTVIPVHNSGTRTSHTVAGGVIALDPDEALWYELPIGEAAASQPARFHIMGTTSSAAYVVPPHWILVVRRTAWSASHYAPEYRWGDGRQQDPWRTPVLNSGWIDGTIPGRYTKSGDQRVEMRGRVRSGAGSAFTLPPGYRPSVQHEAFVRDGAGAAALITITSAGVVTTAGNNTDHSIATSFVADQP